MNQPGPFTSNTAAVHEAAVLVHAQNRAQAPPPASLSPRHVDVANWATAKGEAFHDHPLGIRESTASSRPPVSPRMAHAPVSADLSVGEFSLSGSVSPAPPVATTPTSARRTLTAREWARSISGTTSPAKEPRSASLSRRDSFAASFASAVAAASEAGSPDGTRTPSTFSAGSPCGVDGVGQPRRIRRVVSLSQHGASSRASTPTSGMDEPLGRRGSPLPPLIAHPPAPTSAEAPNTGSARFPLFTLFGAGSGGGGNAGHAWSSAVGAEVDRAAEKASCETSLSWGAIGGGGTNSLTSSRAFANGSPAAHFPGSPSVSTSALLQFTEQEQLILEENERALCLEPHREEMRPPVPVVAPASARSDSLSRCSQSFSTLFRREHSGSFGIEGDYHTGPTPLAWQHSSFSNSVTSLSFAASPRQGALVDSAGGLTSLSVSSPSLDELSGRASPSAMASAATMLAHAAARAALLQHPTPQHEYLEEANAVLTNDADVVLKRHRLESDLDVISRALSSAPSSQLLDCDASRSFGEGERVSPTPYTRHRRQVSPSLARPADEEFEDDAVRGRGGETQPRSGHRRRDCPLVEREVSLPPPPHCDKTPQPSQCQRRYGGGGGGGRGAFEEMMSSTAHRPSSPITNGDDTPPLCRVVDFCPTACTSAAPSRASTPAPRPGCGSPVAVANTPQPTRQDHDEPPCRLSGLSTCSVDSDEPEVDAAGLLRQDVLAEDADSLVMQDQEARLLRQHLTVTSQHARDLLARGDEDSIHLLAELVEEAGREGEPAGPQLESWHNKRTHRAPSLSAVVNVNSPLSSSLRSQEWCRPSPQTPASVFRDVSPPLRERSMAPHEVMRGRHLHLNEQ